MPWVWIEIITEKHSQSKCGVVEDIPKGYICKTTLTPKAQGTYERRVETAKSGNILEIGYV